MFADIQPSGGDLAAGAAAQMSWSAFRDHLPGLDVVKVSGHAGYFRSHVDDRTFGPLKIRLVGSCGVGLRGERSKARIDGFRESLFWVGLVLGGSLTVRQNGRGAQLGAGGFALLDATQPYLVHVPEASTETLWIGVPRASVAERIVDIDAVLGADLNDGHGAGAMTARMLRAAFGGPMVLAGADASRMAEAMINLLATAANAHVSCDTSSSYRTAILRRIKRHIEFRLGDAGLRVDSIARDHGFSTRYLAKLFQAEGATASAWIWRRRLELCREQLLGAGPRPPISNIAYAHGFKSVAHFSRAYRKRYGQSPSATRALG